MRARPVLRVALFGSVLAGAMPGCRSKPTARYEEIARKVNPIVTELQEPFRRMVAVGASDQAVLEACRGQDAELGALQAVPRDTGFDHIGRDTDLAMLADWVRWLSPPCHEEIPRRPAVCARMCLDLWIALAHETLRLQRHARHYGVEIAALRVTP